ncbi:MAG: response regulator, partial [Pseudomonadales bacterium]|nr:response regulator [Pseudomonadales bacterium]
LRNAPQGGAEVELLFPRAPELRTALPELEEELPERPETPPLRVLVVEDEAAVRTLVIGLLRHLGHEATSVTSAAEARDSFRSGAFDLLLTDVVLAAGDGGARLAEELREQDPALAVLLMSGYADGMVGDSEFALASFPLLVKPFGTRALEAAIAALLSRQGRA